MAVWSKINLSALGHAQRFEAEYYKPEYLKLDAKLNNVSAVPLNRYLSYLTDGTHITPKYDAHVKSREFSKEQNCNKHNFRYSFASDHFCFS